MDDMPVDPFVNADMLPMGKSAFEMYGSFKAAGFSEGQAMQMTIAIVTTMIQNVQQGMQGGS